MSIDGDLRRTSDRLLAQLSHLAELETAKRDARPGTSEFVELSRQVEAVAAEVLGISQQQSQLATASRVLRQTGSDAAPSQPISATPPVREAHVILAEWREAERRLAAALDGSPDAELARADVDRLRDEYRRSFEARR
ncbi:MAG TPA: hypothetical protein VFS32_02300 [Candidatus Limnocylindrales bacterium]|nr:hypothetical protein [Candidatus Limnocylindrales bacterium]